MTRTRESPLYGNCIIEAPDGQPLCRTNETKIKWYVDRSLGEVINKNPTTLRLYFEPKGRHGAQHPYSIAEKDNICVVCGLDNEITRHHVVPKCFRKHFPLDRKEHAIHDVLILCVDCHNTYETQAFVLKQQISNETGVQLGGCAIKPEQALFGVRTAAHALANHFHKIPLPRREELLDRLRVYFGRQEITMEDILYIDGINPLCVDPDFKSYGQAVVEGLESIDDFVIRWRQHFIFTMDPKHLPAYWDVYNKFD